ncbi:hypothetical protein GCM10027568_31800 [Humibacter soli]
MTLIDFPQRRVTGSADEGIVCECGGQWFTLLRVKDGRVVPGAVVLDRAGTINGYSGFFRCNDCGHEYEP